MTRQAKDRYKLLVDPEQDLFRWKVDAYPALIYAVCRGMTKSSYAWPKSEALFIGQDLYWYSNWSDIWSHGDKYIKKYLKNSRGRLPSKVMIKYNKSFRDLRHSLADIAQLDIANLSLTALEREWFNFFKSYSHFWSILTEVEVLSYSASHRLEQLISAQSIPISPEEISQLSAFPQRSYLLEEEYELLKIGISQTKAKQQKSLVQHATKFSWILNGYYGTRSIDKKFFQKRLHKLLAQKDYQQHYKHLENYYEETNQRFYNIIKKYKLNSEVVKYAKLAQQSSFIQDKRKAISWQATDYIIKLYQALAKFLGISLEQSLYILPDEFDRALSDKAGLLADISRRQQSCRLHVSAGQAFISTANVDKIFSIFEKAYSAPRGQEIRGIVAQAGYVRGRVQVITSSRQLSSFKAKHILVSQMTSPDYVVAMKKAKAIITDDGGLTCHAAIIARELKKPAIVGTRNASKILYDGDLVVVDANIGIVRLLQRVKK